jgi:hypothetical protein
MISASKHVAAFKALFADQEDVAAAQRVHDLALVDPAGARQALERLTKGHAIRKRFVSGVRIPTVAELSRAGDFTTVSDEFPRSLDDLVGLMELEDRNLEP